MARDAAPIPNSIQAMSAEMAEWRQDFHAHPELGYQEHRTASVIAEKLRAFGLDRVETGIGGTGVIGVLHGEGGVPGSEENAIMIRADMDALPMSEETGLAYASQNDGRMHACGHDGHTTMLLGAARHLAETRNFKGTLYFCFQPAEEGGAGARAMIEDGLFERFPCRAVFGLHNWPSLPVGQFAVKAGPMLAGADEFRITIKGRGGHAAKPDKARDPILAGAQLVSAMQSVIARFTDPLQSVVLSITQFHAGSAFNVIPEEAQLAGTVRCFDEATHTNVYDHMQRICDGIAAAYDLEIVLNRGAQKYYPPTLNDTAVSEQVRSVLEEITGEGMLHTDFPPTMGAEDFAFYSRLKPSCFVFTGNGDTASLHNPKYDFNDEVLPHGTAYWARLVETLLPR
ncbi:MAG: M20 family metallopeptidase [Neomegalonema sp.]|nr:M20 family metallopeptidase [Neomegalonema sp.]